MSDPNHKPRRNRRFRVEILESRDLLSGIGVPSHGAAEVSPLARPAGKTFTVSLSGQGSLSPISSTRGTLTGEASGTAPLFGPVTAHSTASYAAQKHGAIKYTHGVATVTDSKGDVINVTFTGSGHAKGTTQFNYSVKGPVKGGVGLFAGAAGKFTATGTFNAASGAFTMNAKVTLTHL
jgi:hypothetical protein